MEQEIKDPFDIITFGVKPNMLSNILDLLNNKFYTD